MAAKQSKTRPSRFTRTVPPVEIAPDYGEARYVLVAIFGILGITVSTSLFNELDWKQFSWFLGGQTSFDLAAMLISPVFWKTFVGFLVGGAGGWLFHLYFFKEIPAAHRARANSIARVVAILLITTVVYIPAMSAGFIWDDDQEITANPSLLSVDGLKDIWKGTKSADYFPLKTTMLWLEFQLGNSESFKWDLWNLPNLMQHQNDLILHKGPGVLNGFHIVNILLHAIDAVLLLLVLKRLRIPGAWLVSLLFAIHPVHAESVAWIAERKNTLSLFFFLLTLLAYFRFEDKPRWGTYLWALLWFLAALLCKTHVVVLPMVLLLCSWWRHGISGLWSDPIEDDAERRHIKIINAMVGIFGILAGIGALIYLGWLTKSIGWLTHPLKIEDPTDAYLTATHMFKNGGLASEFWFLASICIASGVFGLVEGVFGQRLNRFLIRSLAFFQIAVLLGALTVWFQYGRAIGDERIPLGGLPSKVANAGKASWWYLSKAISPVSLWYEMPNRPVEPEADALAIVDGKKPPVVAPSLPIGEVKLIPLITIYPRWRITPPTWYDFIPAVMMALLVVSILMALLKGRSWARPVFFALAYFLVTLLPVLGFLKMSYMRLTLVADHFQYFSDISVIALLVAAGLWLYRRVGMQWKRALMGACVLLVAVFCAYSWDRAGVHNGEETLWRANLVDNPYAWQAHNHMGAVLYMQGKVDEAQPHFAAAVKYKPENPESHNNLGLSYGRQGDMDTAIKEYYRAVEIKGDDPAMRANLGNGLLQARRYDEAVAQFEECLRMDPNNPAIHCNIGYAFQQQGRINEAVEHYRRALQLDPNMPQARRNLEALHQQ